jgi:F-type H+-transporting ATPase subunit b
MLATAEFWVAVAFAIFVGVLIYLGAHKLIIDALDERAAKIKAELDEARRLREEAQSLLAEYERKKDDAAREAAGIIEGAKQEAERLAPRPSQVRGIPGPPHQAAETKIAQAEAQAVADVRNAAAEAAVAAAERVLTDTVKGKLADDFIDKGIAEVKAKLN